MGQFKTVGSTIDNQMHALANNQPSCIAIVEWQPLTRFIQFMLLGINNGVL